MKYTSLAGKLGIGLVFLLVSFENRGSSPAHALANITKHDTDTHLAQTGTIVFAVIGDFGIANAYETDVAKLIKGWQPDFIVTVGDNNYPKGAASSIDENIGRSFHEFIYPYKGRYGAGADTNRFFPALGNHDWMSDGAKPYLKYFALPGNERYYDVVQGPVHLFILDSDPSEPDGVKATSKQAMWLKDALAASTSPFKLVFMHHPPYSSGTHGSTAYMQWPFQEWGADAVIAGHDHLYERLIVGGFPYFVDGFGGSAPLYNFLYSVPQSEGQVRFNQDYGAMRIEASSTYLKIQAISRTGYLIDQYTINKTLPRILPSVTAIRRANSESSDVPCVDFNMTFQNLPQRDTSDFTLTNNSRRRHE